MFLPGFLLKEASSKQVVGSGHIYFGINLLISHNLLIIHERATSFLGHVIYSTVFTSRHNRAPQASGM